MPHVENKVMHDDRIQGILFKAPAKLTTTQVAERWNSKLGNLRSHPEFTRPKQMRHNSLKEKLVTRKHKHDVNRIVVRLRDKL